MVNMNPDDFVEQIANELRAQAVRLWGEASAVELESSIKQTAGQLWDLGRESIDRDLEPGFYQ